MTRAHKATATRDALFRAALSSVAEHGYAKASVARITQAAGVSQGTFYSYFDSLQQLLAELLPVEGEKLLNELAEKARGSTDYFDLERNAFHAFFDYNARNGHFLRVLTEAEIAAPQSFREHMTNVGRRYLSAFRRGARDHQIRPQSAEAFRVIADILSGARGHIAMGVTLVPVALSMDSIANTYIKFISSGLGRAQETSARPGSIRRPLKFHPSQPTDVQSSIIDAAGALIYRHGFMKTTIADMAQAAGVGISTFYRHFESRESLLGALLASLRHELLNFVRAEVAASRSFAELEQRGFLAFFEYIFAKPWMIRIESEAALWAPESYAEHMREFAARYVAAMDRSKQNGELLEYNLDELSVLAFIFMAARHYLAVRYLMSGKNLPRSVQDTYADFVQFGLRSS